MYRSLGAVALLILAIAVPAQDAAAQDPLGGAILGGAAGAILGGALGGGRGAAAVRLSAGLPALPLLHKGNRGQGATAITSTVATRSVATERGSSSRQSIARRRLSLQSRLLHRRRTLGSCVTNCVIACSNCARGARTATVAPACGLASSSVKIGSGARLGGVTIPSFSFTNAKA